MQRKKGIKATSFERHFLSSLFIAGCFYALSTICAHILLLGSEKPASENNNYVISTKHKKNRVASPVKITSRKHNKNDSTDKTLYLMAPPRPGRLGNCLFSYAATMGIARKNGMVPCVGNNSPNDNTLKLNRTFVFPDGFLPCNNIEWKEPGYATYHDFSLQDSNSLPTIIQLNGYFQSFKYFDEIQQDVLNAFQLVPPIKKITESFLEGYENNVKVGIHIRRTDMIEEGYLTIPTEEYFRISMDRMNTKYGTSVVTYFIASDDIEWCTKQKIFQSRNVVFTNQSDIVDFAILIECDHLIMTIGSYGWWAAWLGPYQNGGDILYPSNQFDMEHEVNKGKVNIDDYFPKDWIEVEST